MTALLVVFAVAFGLAIGSFLNVVLYRLPRGQSIVRPGSRCPSCGTALAGRDNIPVFSWIALSGRCRYCAAPISIRYLLIEVTTGVSFGLAALALATQF